VLVVLVRLLRAASIGLCLIVLASFVAFAVDRTGSASSQQQQTLSETTTVATTVAAAPAKPHASGLHSALDDASEQITAPFAGFVSGSGSEWGRRGVELFLTLLVYGFGLGYLARVLRVRT
jgi:hypothetical protein